MIKRLAWVTARGLDEDEPLALAALGRTGVAVDVVEWDDPGVRWSGYDRVPPRAGTIETLFAVETNAQHVATTEQAAAAVDAVSRRPGTPAYARVDLVRDDNGRYRVLDVELIEPSLFLPYAGAAADRLAEVLVG